jgi:protein-S-isoprenylcysteine O-methyltransferase Ste14
MLSLSKIAGMQQSTFAERGGYWVLAQFVLLPLCALAAAWFKRVFEPAWIPWLADAGRIVGSGLLLASIALLLAAVSRLGASFTPFPKPLEQATLAESGVYNIVRHPIYAAVCGATLGLMLSLNSLLGLLCAAAVFVFFDRKSALEETFLVQRYVNYEAYRLRVKKLIPWVY